MAGFESRRLIGRQRDTAEPREVEVSPDGAVYVTTGDSESLDVDLRVAGADVSPANPVPVSAGGTPVAVASAGTTISQTPTITAGAYAAGDAVGGLLTFADAARTGPGGGVIKDMLILDDAGQDVAMELWLFREAFTAMVDNAPWAPSEADLRKLIAIISTADGAWFAAGTPSAARVEASQRYDLTGTSMFGQVVNRGVPTFAATDDVTVIIGLLQD